MDIRLSRSERSCRISWKRAGATSPRSVVITVDDGHASVFTEMLPIVREYKLPVTLFIYPSAISNALYAMKWDQLAALSRTGLFDIQSHTYWHPNFKTEKRRLSAEAFQSFMTMQFAKPRTVLKNKLVWTRICSRGPSASTMTS